MFFDPPMFVLIHVVLSILGILSGLIVVGGLMGGARFDGWTAFFLLTTILTNVTGFGFPFTKVGPPHVVGAISLVLLAVCVAARYWRQMAGGWRSAYVFTAVASLYLNVFVLIAQLFNKTPALAIDRTDAVGATVRGDAGAGVPAVRGARLGGLARRTRGAGRVTLNRPWCARDPA
ncbi:MAG TPA: hypothetical protein VLE94_19390 [Burkholderiaceae bacterium]|nr:hypothetical protein [Burkholderiaceae bacterium]